MLFQMNSHTYAYHFNLQIAVHATEVNLKELFQTKPGGKPGSEQYCFMSLFNPWVVKFTSTQGSLL